MASFPGESADLEGSVTILRRLVWLDIAGILLLIPIAFFDPQLADPALVEAVEAAVKEPSFLETAGLLGAGAILLISVIVAWVGLLRLKPFGRTLYTFTLAAGLLLTPLGYSPTLHWLESLVYSSFNILNGVILCLIWIGPLRSVFAKNGAVVKSAAAG